MKIKPVFLGDGRVHAIETDDGEVLIFCPDASGEASLARSRQWRNVEHHATDFAEEFAPDIFKLIILTIESLGIDEDHAQKNFR
jgi:hypothetical protein